jgi:anthranilate/para-aminobenzoate synthase component II
MELSGECGRGRVKHRDYEIYGLQFHPESILTPQGATIIENFLSPELDADRLKGGLI